jgi:hypothetical protein
MNALIIQNGYATIAKAGGEIIETTLLHEDRYVRIDDGSQYPQLCHGANHLGNTIIYRDDEQLAHACKAKLYKTRAAFDRAAAKLAECECA